MLLVVFVLVRHDCTGGGGNSVGGRRRGSTDGSGIDGGGGGEEDRGSDDCDKQGETGASHGVCSSDDLSSVVSCVVVGVYGCVVMQVVVRMIES